MVKSCGTCVHWGVKDHGGGYHFCEWEPMEPLPFWAEIDRGADHNDYTLADQGKRCPTWVLTTRLARG